jgi:hypothetical protein
VQDCELSQNTRHFVHRQGFATSSPQYLSPVAYKILERPINRPVKKMSNKMEHALLEVRTSSQDIERRGKRSGLRHQRCHLLGRLLRLQSLLWQAHVRRISLTLYLYVCRTSVSRLSVHSLPRSLRYHTHH